MKFREEIRENKIMFTLSVIIRNNHRSRKNLSGRGAYLPLACVLCGHLFFLGIAYAADPDPVNAVGPSSLERTRKEVMIGHGDKSTFDRDGRDLNTGAYERSPILFDPLGNDTRARVFPQSTAQKSYSRESLYDSTVCKSEYQQYFPTELKTMCDKEETEEGESFGNNLAWEKKTSNLPMTNLMVDDEISKAEMAVFIDTDFMHDQYADDEQQNKRTIENLNRLSYITAQSLGFLDKSISAAAATARSQADTNTMLQLLRQINISTSQVANPERNQIYRDWHEKFEACMWAEGDKSKLDEADGRGDNKFLKHVNFILPDKFGGGHCLDSGSYCRKLHGMEDGSASTKGLYGLCSCCADRVLQVNDSSTKSVEETEANRNKRPYKMNLCKEALKRLKEEYPTGKYGDAKEDVSGGSDESESIYSLVERVFIGMTYTPDSSSNSNSNSWDNPQILRSIVSNYAHFFQDIYGDVCTFETKEGFIRKKYIPPFWSVPQLVDLMRNGKPDEVCDRSTTYCPITSEEVQVGICPAFKLLLALESKNELHKALTEQSGAVMTKSEVESYWIQATLGDSLSARDFQNVINNHSKHPEFNRYVETFCDASAAAAVKKLHTRMMSIGADYMLYNQKISDDDRRVLRRLMDRMTEYLNLAAQDSNSMASSLLIASELQRNRLDQADRGSFISSALGATRNSAQMDELDAPFGGAAPSSALNAGN